MEKTLDTNVLIASHSDFLFSYALGKTKNRELSLDMVQETLLTAIQKQDQFKGKSQFRTWLTSILNRKIIDFWRSEQRQQNHLSPKEIGDTHVKADNKTSPDSELGQRELKIQLEECIDGLPDKWKNVVNAKFIQELSSEDICESFELSNSNYWVIIHRAKMQLKDCLAEMLD